MKSRFRHILFVCQKERPADAEKGCCAGRGSAALLERLKELTGQHRLKGSLRVTASGCLDYCASGCTVAAWSGGEETWYTHLAPGDADALFEAHILRGEKLARRVQSFK